MILCRGKRETHKTLALTNNMKKFNHRDEEITGEVGKPLTEERKAKLLQDCMAFEAKYCGGKLTNPAK